MNGDLYLVVLYDDLDFEQDLYLVVEDGDPDLEQDLYRSASQKQSCCFVKMNSISGIRVSRYVFGSFISS